MASTFKALHRRSFLVGSFLRVQRPSGLDGKPLH